MKASLSFLSFTMFLSIYCQSQSITSFENILDEIQISNKQDNNKIVERFIELNKKTPIIENDVVIFLAKAAASDSPKLLSDFNGFMNPRYVKDSTLAYMTSIPSTDWYYSKYNLSMDARINYQFLYGTEKKNDPLNPDLRINFGKPISFVQMPKHEVFNEGLKDFSVARGKLIQETFDSQILGHSRKIHTYLPPNYDSTKEYPSVFFHDGSFFVGEANVAIILDNLISSEQIRPIVAIFDDPVIRGKEYRNDPDFRSYLKEELLPYFNEKYGTSKNLEHRAVIGFSRGGLSALYLSHSLEEFSMCGALAPAIHPKSIKEFVSELDLHRFPPNKVFITRSNYDKIWNQDAVDLKIHFEQKENLLQYKEINEGHNIPAWRTLIDDMLRFFFAFE